MKLSEKWGLQSADGAAAPENALPPLPTVDVTDSAALHTLEQAVTAAPYVAVLAPEGLDALTLCDGKACYALAWAQLGDDYNAFLRLLFSDRVRKAGHNIKDLMRALLAEGLPTDGFVFDTALAAYLLDATAGNYDLSASRAGVSRRGSAGCADRLGAAAGAAGKDGHARHAAALYGHRAAAVPCAGAHGAHGLSRGPQGAV